MVRVIADSKVSEETLVSTTPKKMKVIADLQIHSKYSRATSKALSFVNLVKYGKMKGVDLFGVGDFQHPEQWERIREELEEDENGILWLKGKKGEGIGFIWQTEISLMFSQGGRRRAAHMLVFAPDGVVAEKIKKWLESKGRTDYDGRPIFGMSCRDFVKDLKEIDDKIEIIPAHVMTSWFGIFGSKSGFDSLEECFGDMVNHIYAVESGMSADPQMLLRFKEIDNRKIRVVSFSDAHSFWPWRLGREATIFEFDELSYDNVIKAIRTGEGFVGTIETPPAYGKYHWDGHRNCGFSCSPAETRELNGICPKCGKEMVIGVDYRVEEIAEKDRKGEVDNVKAGQVGDDVDGGNVGVGDEESVDKINKEEKEIDNVRAGQGDEFRDIDGFEGDGGVGGLDGIEVYEVVPLHEIISLHLGVGMSSKRVGRVYDKMISDFGNEFKILLEVSKEEFEKAEIDERLIELIMLNRENKLNVKPGFDGEYGVVLMPECTDAHSGHLKFSKKCKDFKMSGDAKVQSTLDTLKFKQLPKKLMGKVDKQGSLVF